MENNNESDLTFVVVDTSDVFLRQIRCQKTIIFGLSVGMLLLAMSKLKKKTDKKGEIEKAAIRYLIKKGYTVEKTEVK